MSGRSATRRTLTRAARDHAEKQPAFAIQAGLLALRWLVQGHGYEITGADVWAAYSNTLKAADRAGKLEETTIRVRQIKDAGPRGGFVAKVLGEVLERR